MRAELAARTVSANLAAVRANKFQILNIWKRDLKSFSLKVQTLELL
jgi:hypothetical protein